MNHLVVIRDYRPGDELLCKEIVREGTMSTVATAFFSGLTRELTFQIIVLTAALMFIFMGVPFTYCIGAVPLVVILMYICVWLGHTYKALELSQDILNIPRVYMSSECTGFWVAEVFEPYFMTRDPSQVKYIIKTERELKDANYEITSHHQKKIVGTIAVTKSRNNEDAAWIRRMVVTSKYQRKGIATALLDEALRFCQEKEYASAELVTSECHDPARELFMKKGFELKQMYHRQIVGTVVTVLMFELSYKIKGNRLHLDP